MTKTTFTLAPGDKIAYSVNLIAASPDLLGACEWFISQLESGQLVRDISRDAEADWSYRMLQFTMNLQKAVSAVARAKGDQND
jgi:hypothetical protein